MNRSQAELIIATVKDFSVQAAEVLTYLQRYDYRKEADEWGEPDDPPLIEAAHPTLRDLYIRLARLTGPIPYRSDNLDRSALLSNFNMKSFANYLEVCQETLLAARFNTIPIEPMQDVSEAFEELGLQAEAARLRSIYNFALGIRRWYKASKHNPGTPIQIIVEHDYADAAGGSIDADTGFTTFKSLFTPSCNYSPKQKRAIYNALRDLYATSDPGAADKTVMAVILLFRKPRTAYKRPFGDAPISVCKSKAMTAFNRDGKTIKAYTENSLTKAPKLGDEHIAQAKAIISQALGTTR